MSKKEQKKHEQTKLKNRGKREQTGKAPTRGKGTTSKSK
jgi:hypothetical protein